MNPKNSKVLDLFNEANKIVTLDEILEYLQKTRYEFKNEKATYIFTQAVAILNHCAKHGNSEYGIDVKYLSEKVEKIRGEF